MRVRGGQLAKIAEERDQDAADIVFTLVETTSANFVIIKVVLHDFLPERVIIPSLNVLPR